MFRCRRRKEFSEEGSCFALLACAKIVELNGNVQAGIRLRPVALVFPIIALIERGDEDE